MDPPLEKTHNSLPLIPNPFSFWNGLRPKEEELDAMWVEGLGGRAIPLPQAACKAGNPLSQHHPLRPHTSPSPIVPGSLMVSQCTYSSKKEACGQHSSIAEAKIW